MCKKNSHFGGILFEGRTLLELERGYLTGENRACFLENVIEDSRCLADLIVLILLKNKPI